MTAVRRSLEKLLGRKTQDKFAFKTGRALLAPVAIIWTLTPSRYLVLMLPWTKKAPKVLVILVLTKVTMVREMVLFVKKRKQQVKKGAFQFDSSTRAVVN